MQTVARPGGSDRHREVDLGRQRRLFLCVTLILLGVTAPLTGGVSAKEPATPQGWQLAGQIGGPTTAVAIQGTYAYLGVGLRLVVLDIANPAAPTEAGSTAPFPYAVEDIAVAGTWAYVAAGGAGLRVVDVSDPARPSEIGAWDSPGYAEGVAVVGQHAYLADGPYGLRAVDISDPAHPLPLGAAYDMSYAFDVAVSGGHAYVAAAGAGLLVADVADPAHPSEASALDTPGYAYGVAAVGHTVYLADGWEGVRVVDGSDPSAPAEIGAFKTPGWAFGLAVLGSRLYVADAFMGLRVLDVSDPEQPREMGGYAPDGGHAGKVVVSGQMAYVADRNEGMRAVDVSDPAHPAEVALYSPMGNAQEVSVSGALAFVAAGSFGLRIVDVSEPAHPKQVGALDLGTAEHLEVADDYAYVCGYSDRWYLFVVDVSNPAQPFLAGQVAEVNPCRDLEVRDRIVYIPDESGLEVIDAAEPDDPVLLAYVPMQDWPGSGDTTTGVAVSGTLAYVASSWAGVEVVDVSDPASPVLAGAWESGEYLSNDLALLGNRAYLAQANVLRILDLSDPLHPAAMGLYQTLGAGCKVAVTGNLAYVADGGIGVTLVDVSDPYSPAPAGAANTPGYAYEAVLRGERMFVADGSGGLLILEKTAGEGASERELHAGTSPAGNAARPVALSRWPLTAPPSGRVSGEDPTGPAATPLADRPWSGRPQLARPPAGSFTTASPSVCTVTSAADSGAGSLRGCLASAVSGTHIVFDLSVFSPGSPVTITILSELPVMDSGGVTLDASDAGVILDGSRAPGGTSGLQVCSDGNTVQGLQIVRFPGSGIFLGCGQDNLIGGDRSVGAGPTGQGNLASANGASGIDVYGPETISNTVSGNLVGTDVSGTVAWGNGNYGAIFLAGGCSRNVIGGRTPGERNIVSGNLINGIQVQCHDNLVIGNYVGTDVSGSLDLGNVGHGISIEGGTNNRVEANLSSGNDRAGLLAGGGDYNVFVGNRVGTDAEGTHAIPNGWVGVYVDASFTRIGGTGPGEGNLISGNLSGIEVGGPAKVGNLVLGNLLGTDLSGTQSLPNLGPGVTLNPSGQTIVGGATPAERNVISGNGVPPSWSGGVAICGSDHAVMGNTIGTDSSGALELGNRGAGVWLRGAERSFIQGNRIAHNSAYGVLVESDAFNTIRRNRIFDHPDAGIYLQPGGNQLLPAPVITSVSSTGISGTACPGCTVEVFSDDEDEGRVYEGTVVAGASGFFAFDKGSPLAGPYLTATATDAGGNTSGFSAPAWLAGKLYLPLCLRAWHP